MLNVELLLSKAKYPFIVAASEADFAVVFKRQQFQADLRAASGAIFISLLQPYSSSQVLT